MKLDHDDKYSYVPYLTEFDKFSRKISENLNIMENRLRCMKHADYFIFVKHWEDTFVECKCDRAILKLMETDNILTFQIVNGKAVLI